MSDKNNCESSIDDAKDSINEAISELDKLNVLDDGVLREALQDAKKHLKYANQYLQDIEEFDDYEHVSKDDVEETPNEIKSMETIFWRAENRIDIEIMEAIDRLLFDGMPPHKLLDLLSKKTKV
jgi:hypothetical protein